MSVVAFVFVLGASQVPSIVVETSRTTPISPFIYGANHPDWAKLQTPFPMARQGGNRMTAYNWETNASNAGNDYRNQNDGYMGETNEPGWAVHTFLDAAQGHGANALLTIPTAGYVSADKGPDNDVNLTPDYLEKRFFKTYAKKPGGKFENPPNTKDRAVYMDEMVAFLESVKSPKTEVWYSLDNEPDLWQSTHSRIVPRTLTYAEIIKNNTDFARAIKDVAPKSKVFGPANYGWQGFRRFQDASDANNRDFLDVYLTAMKAAEANAGKRLIDALDIHWYPEARGDGVRICFGDDKPGTPAARMQAPRSLWDPTYVEDSWIAESLGKKPIVLLPGVLKQIDAHYPGTKLAITEYDFGGAKSPSGTIAQADVLGIYGRYGVWAACHWGISDDRPATLAGMRAFLAYDGKAKFGDLGLPVTGYVPADESAYASLDSKNPNRMVVVLVNKRSEMFGRSVRLKGFAAKSVRAFVANPGDPLKPKVGAAVLKGDTVTVQMPATSVITLELTR